MICNSRKYFILMIMLAVYCSEIYPQNQFKIRAWQFHDYNVRYIENSIKLAPKYNINTIVFSHAIIWYTEEIFYDHYKARYINLWSKEAHEGGMKAWIWTHELNAVPDKFLTGHPPKAHAEVFHEWIGNLDSDFIAGVKVNIDKLGFWGWITKKYTRLFTMLPNIDGMILTLHETPYRIFANDAVISNLSKPERITKLVTDIDNVCRKFHKTLIVRTFAVEPKELTWLKEGLEKSPDDVIIMTKCVPHDWYPYLPNNPLLGVFKHHKQILEMGTNAENGGMNYIPYPQVGYTKMRLDYARSKDVVGYVARMGTQDNHVLGTPNEISLYAIDKFTEDPNLTPDSLWHEWANKNYGSKAATYMIRALRPAFYGVNKMFFFQGMWLTDHSRIPTYEYAKGHISSRNPTKWEKSSKYEKIEKEGINPTVNFLEKVLAEKEDAIRIQATCKAELDSAKQFLNPAIYQDLNRRFEIWYYDAQTWRSFGEAFFSYRIFEETGNKMMLIRCQRSLKDLAEWASLTSKRFGEDIMRNNPARVIRFVNEIRKKIAKTK